MAGYTLFLERALQKILSDRETRRSHHAKLRQSCEQALERLQASFSGKGRDNKHGNASAPTSSDVEQYYMVLEQVCKTRSPRLVSTALDCLQKLIAPGYLTGLSADPEAPGRPLIDRIVETVCYCFAGASTDEDVQLQIIKALLTMMTSTTCAVHEGSLLQVIRTCYNIYLASRKPINQATAKTTLTQIVNVIFQRMENQSELPANRLSPHTNVSTSSSPTPVTKTHVDRHSLNLSYASSPSKPPSVRTPSSSTSPTAGENSVDIAMVVPTEHEIMEEFASTGLPNHSPYSSQELRSSLNPSPNIRRSKLNGPSVGSRRSDSSVSSSHSSLRPQGSDSSLGGKTESVSDSGQVSGGYAHAADSAMDGGPEVASHATIPSVEANGSELEPVAPGANGEDSSVPDIGDESHGPVVTESGQTSRTGEECEDEADGDRPKEDDVQQDQSMPADIDSKADSKHAESPVDKEFDVSAEVRNLVEEIVSNVCLEHASVVTVKSCATPPRPMSPSASMTVLGPTTMVYVGGTPESTPTPSDQRSLQETPQAQLEGSWGFDHVVQKDAFLVFRSLCKLSMKAIESHDPKSHELRSKVLSLELLLTVLEGAGPLLRSDPMFLNAIKQYLCVALSKNGVSNVPQVFDLSLSIFLALLNNFKEHLKMQIEVFFKEIFLSILQSSTSSFQHKLLVTNALKRICKDAQCIVNIYLNYDCDLSLANIFERLVGDIAHIAQGSSAVMLGHPTPQQEKSIQRAGMECLVGILQSLVEWSRDLYVYPGVAALAQRTVGIETAFPLSREGRTALAQDDVEAVAARCALKVDSSSSLESASSSSLHSSSQRGLDVPEEFEDIKRRKHVMEEGLAKFHQKPRRGIKFLQDNELLGPEPADVAMFFLSDDRLDPVSVGEYLGEADKYCIDVMYSYVDLLEFTDMDFVPALRMFLSGFRLPGEAQKIDRLMEKYASRYCETNSGTSVFASADTAYVLAYSIIMLATDLHSTKIKRENKMTKEQYTVKIGYNDLGYNDKSPIPTKFLCQQQNCVHLCTKTIGYNDIANKDKSQITTEFRCPVP